MRSVDRGGLDDARRFANMCGEGRGKRRTAWYGDRLNLVGAFCLAAAVLSGAGLFAYGFLRLILKVMFSPSVGH
jgi:hypothetical protein